MLLEPHVYRELARYLQLYNYGDPHYAPLVLSGLLMVLIIHLVFHGSQMLCEVVLGFLADQTSILAPYIPEGRRQQIAKSYPATIKTVLDSFDLEPSVRRYVQCPSCFALYPEAASYPDWCTNIEAPGSKACQAKLTRRQMLRGKEHRRPIKVYVHQGLSPISSCSWYIDVESL